MKKEQLPAVYYRGNEFVMVQKGQEGFGPGSVVCVDANEDGDYEYETIVGKDGIWSLSFEFAPGKINKEGLPVGPISMFTRTADGSKKTDLYTFLAIQESTENPAKAIPENCAIEVPVYPEHAMEYTVNPENCLCTSCPNNDTLMGFSLEGFSGSYTPSEVGVETASGMYRNAYQITSFDTRMLGFSLNLHHSSMVKYDGPVGQSFSHSFNMMIVQDDELTGQIVTPDLRIFDIYSEDGINWHLPIGFFSRLCLEPDTHRWILTHHSGLEVAFYQAIPGCPGYPISITEPNGTTACMTYNASGYLQDVTTDLGQIQVFQYDTNGRLSTFTDHINRTWQFPHDAEGRLSGINTPATTYANIPAGREITDNDLDDVVVTSERCWVFGYRDDQFPNQITSETDPRGATYRENIFDDRGRVVTARINGSDVRIDYDSVDLPLTLEKLEAGNLVRSITDREGNVTYQEIHGIQGGPKNKLGKFGLRRSISLTERGKGNAPLRDDEPDYWEQRWLHDCDCLVPIVETQPFSSNDLANIQFDEFGIPQNMPREIFTFNQFRQKTAWTYTDGTESISKQWTYQRKAFGDNQQFSRMLTETDAREFDDNPIYAGINFIHTHQYDAFGNHTRHDAPTVSLGTDTPQKISEKWTFNEFGQPLSHIDANGNITTYAYFDGSSSGGDINTKGRFGGYLKSMTRGADGSADPVTNLMRKFKVNALGMNTRQRDENGFNYDTHYNNLQEIERQRQPSVTLTNGQRVRYEIRNIFDGAGNIVMTRRSNIDLDATIFPNAWIDRSVSYDVVNNQLSERVDIDANDANDLITQYAYDNNDDQIVVKKPEGNRSFSIYDERRLTFKTFYGVAPAPPNSGSSIGGGTPFAGYPANKRALTLDDIMFVGLSINTYDASSNRVRTRDGRGNNSLHFFDFYNREVAYSDPNGNGWVREFDDASNVLTESRGAVSETTGQITELLERSYSRFDEFGRQYQQVRDIDLSTDESRQVNPDDGKNSSYLTVFDPGSRRVAEFDANTNATTYTYDAADRRLTVYDALGNVIAAAYDPNSNLIRMTETEVPGPGATGEPETHVATYAYDEINRRTEKHVLGLGGNSIDHRVLFAYDSRSNERLMVDTEDNVTITTFDDHDRKVMIQRFDGDPFIESATELTHYEYDYDRNSNKIEERALADVNDPYSAQRTRYAYDDLDRQVRIVFPDSDDPVAGGYSGPDARFDHVEIVFDENSNPVLVIEQRGIVARSRFDPGDRLMEQVLTLPAAVPGQKRRVYAYDALDRTTVARNDFAEVKTEYDPLSRIIAETQSIRLDSSGFTTGWKHPVRVTSNYDKQSNRTGHMVLDGADTDLAVTTSYDALNRADQISAQYFDAPSHTIAGFSYFGAWREQRRTLGNGAKLTNVFDVKRRLQSHAWTGPSRTLVGFEYDYDRMDNPSFERFTHDMGLYDYFRYNARYEVTDVDYRTASATPPLNLSNIFYYDDVFNRRQASFGDPFDAGSNTLDCYTVNGANEYTRLMRNGVATNPTYDCAGNATTLPVRPVSDSGNVVLARARWDADNSLFDIEMDNTAKQYYRYDALRRRIASLELTGSDVNAGSRRYIYDDWQVVEERVFDDGATLGRAPSKLERIYVNGREIDRPLLTAIDRNGDRRLGGPASKNEPDASADQEYYFLDNRPGSVMALLDADNADRILEYYRYTVYGDPTVLTVTDADGDRLEDTPLDLSDNARLQRKRTSSEFGNVYLFTGRRFDDKTSLYYYRNRYYEPTSGRFLSRDLFFGYENELSLYSYVRNNPTNHIDPMGTIDGDIDEMMEERKKKMYEPFVKVVDSISKFVPKKCKKKPKTPPTCASTAAALIIRKQKGHSLFCSWALTVARNKAPAKCPPSTTACTGGCPPPQICLTSVAPVRVSYATSIFDCKARLFFTCPCLCL